MGRPEVIAGKGCWILDFLSNYGMARRGVKVKILGGKPDEGEVLPNGRGFLRRFLQKLSHPGFQDDRGMIPFCVQPFKVWRQPLKENDFPSGDIYIQGDVLRKIGRPVILLCAHEARKELFGGERSFLDILEALVLLDLNVIVTLPEASNFPYLQAVKRCAGGVYVFKYKWWSKGTAPAKASIARFQAIVEFHQATVVHVNTLMLREPLIAARNAGVAGIVHVREMIADDPALAAYIGLRPEEIVKQVRAAADLVITNSKSTAAAFGDTLGTSLVPNIVQTDVLDISNPVDPQAIVFGLIGSNLKKKGIFDFIEVAKLCEKSEPNAVFAFIGLYTGPGGVDMEKLKRKYAAGKLPGNLRFLGYKETPLEAVSETNVVLNLSLFAESFGRSVAEAMAARRPVIAYAWGALPELVKDGVSGYLVPFRDVRAVAARVAELCRAPERIQVLGAAGRDQIKDYSRERLSQRLNSIYAEALSKKQPEKCLRKSG